MIWVITMLIKLLHCYEHRWFCNHMPRCHCASVCQHNSASMKKKNQKNPFSYSFPYECGCGGSAAASASAADWKKEKANKLFRKKTQGRRARGPRRGSPGRWNDGSVQRCSVGRCGLGSALPDKCWVFTKYWAQLNNINCAGPHQRAHTRSPWISLKQIGGKNLMTALLSIH